MRDQRHPSCSDSRGETALVLGLASVLESFEVGALWMNRPWNHLDDLLPRFEYDYTQEGLKQRLKRDFPNTAELEKLAEEKGIEIKDAFQGDQIGPFTVLAPSLDRYLGLVVDSDKTPEPERAAVIKGTIFERTVELLKKAVAVWGAENLKGESDGTSRENETSVVQFANLCGQKILLTGDAGVEALDEAHEYAMGAEIDVSPRIDRFDVPHHGSRRNVSSDVLDKWLGTKLSDPADPPLCWAVISANRNDEEHPRNAVVRILIHRGAKVVQTKGTIQTGHNAPDREGWSPVTPLTYRQTWRNRLGHLISTSDSHQTADTWTTTISAHSRRMTAALVMPRREGAGTQSAVMAGALSLDRSAGGVCGVMRSRSSCGVQRGNVAANTL